MKRKLLRTLLLSLVLCVSMMLSAVPAMAADSQSVDTTYVVTFRPGANGSFSSGAEGYLSGFGTVARSAVGNLFVEVPAGTSFPAGIVSYLNADDGYYYKEGLSGQTINGDADYVAEYGVLTGSGASYTVEYVDATTGAEVAESYRGFANPGDTITFSAKAVADFTVDAASKSLTISDGAVLQFLYTGTGTTATTEYVYGENTVVENTVVVTEEDDTPAVTEPQTTDAPAVTEPQTTDAPAVTETPADPGETIEDPDVPLAEGETEAPVEEEITDEAVPLAGTTDGMTPLVGAAISGGVLLLIVMVLLRRKRIA